MNGALNNKWRSAMQKVKLQGQKLQKQQNHMRRQILWSEHLLHPTQNGDARLSLGICGPNISCTPPRTEMLEFHWEYVLIVTLSMGRRKLEYTRVNWSTLEYTGVHRSTLEYMGVN